MQLFNSQDEWSFFHGIFFSYSFTRIYHFEFEYHRVPVFFFFQKNKKKNVENAHVAFFFYIREKLTGKYIVHGDDRSSICQPGKERNIFGT